MWRRLGFPHDAQWQRALTATEGAFPHAISAAGKLPHVDRFMEPAVLRGRMRALHKFCGKPRIIDCPPGSKIYMDAAGPMIPYVGTLALHYFGVVCARTGYAQVYPCRSQSQGNAINALAKFVAELRALMRTQGYTSPHVIRSDGGSAFVALRFKEFCTSRVR